jgi:pimeloyl-ACP methyl ester carboxylesterase
MSHGRRAGGAAMAAALVCLCMLAGCSNPRGSLADTMPNSVAHKLDAGHFAWEEAPGEYGRLVSEWIAGGYKEHSGS